jgi:hypothetical protein
MLNFKGTVTVDGDSGDPLPVAGEVTDTHLTVRTRDGSVIGSWNIDELSVVRIDEGVVVQVDGEKLTLAVRKPDSLAEALRVTGTSNVARRIAEVRQTPADSERIRPLLATAVVAGILALFAVVLWITGMPPFDEQSHPVVVATGTSPSPSIPQETSVTSSGALATPSSGAITAADFMTIAYTAMAAMGRENEFERGEYREWGKDVCAYLESGANWRDVLRDLTVQIGFDGLPLSSLSETFVAAMVIGGAGAEAYCPDRVPADELIVAGGRNALQDLTASLIFLSDAIEGQANRVDWTFSSDGASNMQVTIVDLGIRVCNRYRSLAPTEANVFDAVLQEIEQSLDEWPSALQKAVATAPALHFCPRYAHLVP